MSRERTVEGRRLPGLPGLPGLLGIVAVLGAGGGLVAGPALLPADRGEVAAAVRSLPVVRSVPALVCSGPQTLVVPEGGTPVAPGGPVRIDAVASAVATSSAATGQGLQIARLEALGDRSGKLPAATGKPKAEHGHRLDLTAVGDAGAGTDGGDGADGADGGDGTDGGDGERVALGALALDSVGPVVLRARPAAVQESARVVTAAVQSTLVRSGDLRSMTASSCGPAQAESWLVGGGTREGERLRLLLSNPAPTAAVVDLEVRGPDGPVRAESGQAIAVGAGAQVAVLVDALAPGLERVAVHVRARTGQVRAVMHDSRLDGLTPAGADDVAASAPPSAHQVVPGVSVTEAYSTTAGDPEAAGSTSVRIAVPGSVEAVARVRLLDSTGTVELPESNVVTVPAGGVMDIPVTGVPSGTYTALVDADVPVVAAARVGRGAAADRALGEFGWAGAARPLTGSGYVALPPGVEAALSLAAPEDGARVRVVPIGTDGATGEPTTVTIDDGRAVTVRLAAGTAALRLDGITGGPLRGAVVIWATDGRGPLISVLAADLPVAGRPPGRAVRDDRLGTR